MNSRLILASQSAHRKKALEILGLDFDCIPAHIDEKAIRHDNPIKMAQLISEAKALEIAQRESGVIISGDAFLLLKGKVLEKPSSKEEAFEMLSALSENKYEFITALSVYDTEIQKMYSSVSTCVVYFRKLSSSEILDYCNRYPVEKFAGAHETDGVSRFAEKVEGSFTLQTSINLKDLVTFLEKISQEKKCLINS
jgi:septum formation protein